MSKICSFVCYCFIVLLFVIVLLFRDTVSILHDRAIPCATPAKHVHTPYVHARVRSPADVRGWENAIADTMGNIMNIRGICLVQVVEVQVSVGQVLDYICRLGGSETTCVEMHCGWP